jgi:DNA polymerase III alpha subunit
MLYYEFPCGCRWPLLEDPQDTPAGCLPLMDFDVERAPEHCPATWALLGRGLTKGVFQLESPLGRQWSKKLKPENAEHLSALGAILRPGCLQAVDEEGVSTTLHYCRRKNNEEEIKSFHPVVDAILFPTYNVLVYQEQAMAIAQAVAGFNLQEADQLRKAIGKKLAEEMSKCKLMFLEGAKKAGVVSTEQAEQLFGWIQESQRYSFNKCLSLDTKIRRAAKGGHFDGWMTVHEMYRIRHDLEYAKATGHAELRRKWKRLGNYGKGLSMHEDGRIRPNVILDIQPAGKRLVWRVTLSDGRYVDVTANHKFPTPSGVKEAGELVASNDGTGDALYVCGEYAAGRTRRGEKGYPILTIPVVSVVALEEVETYDVTMDAPHHNFVVGDSDIVSCNSHSMCYGLTGYDCAYIKAHFPLAFFTSWLKQAVNKQDPQQEIYELVNDAKLFDICVEPPDPRLLNFGFNTDRKTIKFGLRDVKGVGQAQLDKALTAIRLAEETLGKPLPDWTWYEFLVHASGQITSSVVDRLIKVGALRWTRVGRQMMLEDYANWSELTEKEQAWVIERSTQWTCLADALDALAKTRKEGGGCATQKRVDIVRSLASLLRNPAKSLADTPHWIAWVEEELLGIAISCSKIDSCDISQVNCTCKEYLTGRTGFLMLGVTIEEAREVKTRRGKAPGSKMGRLTVSDGTCAVEAVAFPQVWKDYGHLLREGESVILQGEREDNKDYDSLIIKKAWQAIPAA